MKKALSVLLCAVLLLAASAPAVFAEDTVMISSSSVPATVAYIGSDSRLATIANVFAGYIEKITGIPASVSSSAPEANGFVLDLQTTERVFGGYDLSVSGSVVTIAASDVRGIANGMYDFLHEYCGCAWYTQDAVVVPQAEAITVPGGLSKTYETFFEYADTDWVSPHYEEFSVANGLNGIYSPVSATYGGKVTYPGGFCHTLSTNFVSANTYFDEHPEYFSYRKSEGGRTKDQLCLSNPEVIELVKQQAINVAATQTSRNGAINIISLTQDDNQRYCECDNCQAIVDRYGGQQSGIMLWFVNQVAEAVEEAGYDNVVIDTFAYQYTRKPPKDIRPRDNVCVRLCSIECCFAHALNDPDCSMNTSFMDDLKEWAKLSDRLYVWDYTTNYAQTIGIFPDFGVLQSNIQTFYENNVKGIYEEGAYYMSSCNAEFGDLRSYMIARLLKDPYCDIKAEMQGFYKGFYGAAATQISEFIDFITEHAGNSQGHLGIYYSMRDTLHGWKNKDIERMDKLWEDAIAATADDETANARVLRSQLSWRYWKSVNKVAEFSRLQS
nr:DUF4838 domain-containing protein [Clostridia bacterium]